jgi:hypothetical protein
LANLQQSGRLPRDLQHLRKRLLKKLPQVQSNVYEEVDGQLMPHPNLTTIPRELQSNPNVKRVESFLAVGDLLKHVNKLHQGLFDEGAKANLSSDGVPLSKGGSNTLRVRRSN